MSSAKVDICNMAISHLGIGLEIANIASDSSAAAQACRRFYEPTRDEVLRAFAWPKQTVKEALQVVDEFDADENDWAFSYRYPADAIIVRRLFIPGSGRRETESSRVPYELGRDSAGALIFTDLEDAYVEYTFKETVEGNFDPDFANAFTFLLAFKIAPRLTAGDQFKLGNRAYQFYQIAIAEARANALNELQPDQPPDSQLERSRA